MLLSRGVAVDDDFYVWGFWLVAAGVKRYSKYHLIEDASAGCRTACGLTLSYRTHRPSMFQFCEPPEGFHMLRCQRCQKRVSSVRCSRL